MAEMIRLKAAVVGLGHHAVKEYFGGFANSKFAELTAVCDLDEGKFKVWQDAFGARGYTDFERLFEEEQLDFIVAALPHDCYIKVIEAASKMGIHILKEKPFARNLDEGIRIKDTCEKYGVKLMTAVKRRFNPVYAAFHQYRKEVGVPYLIDLKETLSIEDPCEGWRGSRTRSGGGCILDMGYHAIDLIIWNFGLPDRVYAEASSMGMQDGANAIENSALITFSYLSGLHGAALISRSFPPKTELLSVAGSAGLLQSDGTRLLRMNKSGSVQESLEWHAERHAVMARQIDYFCGAIRGEYEDFACPASHLQHLSFIEACYRSIETSACVQPRQMLIEDARQLWS